MSALAFRRILVALDASPHSQAALREAAALADGLHAELAGIFVLDVELLRMAGLPLAHETGLISAVRRPMNTDDMERALRLQANRARAALEAAAKRYRLRSSFRLLRGNVVAELVAAAANADLLALGATGHMSIAGRRLGSTARGVAAQASCSVLLLTREPREGRSLLVVFGGSPGSERALARGLELARRREADLVVLLCGAGDQLLQLRDRAEQVLAQDGASAAFDDIRPDRIGMLPALLRRYDCRLLVIPHDSELIDGRDELLSDLALPVLLTR